MKFKQWLEKEVIYFYQSSKVLYSINEDKKNKMKLYINQDKRNRPIKWLTENYFPITPE